MVLDFVCVGPQRTGTTWMYEVLRSHPELCLPRSVKETMFFDRYYDRGIDWYARYFDKDRKSQLNGEVAPTYFDVKGVPNRIYEVSPSCNVIISLRHPAERAFSLYLHHLRKGRVPRDFRKAVKQMPRIIEAGRYASHIPRWQSKFGRDNVHMVFLDDIRNNPQKVVNYMCSQIGVRSVDQPPFRDQKVNAASMPRFPMLAKAAEAITTKLHEYGLHSVVEVGKKFGLRAIAYTGGEDDMPVLSESTRTRLIREYEEDIKYVYRETDRDISYWLK